MTRFLSRGWLVGAIALGAIAAPALADGAPAPASDATDDKVARLEALLDAQQRRISQLEQQVSAASDQHSENARVDAMKQQIREVLSEREFRESLMPSIVTAGYQEGSGFYINSGDEKFRMNFSGYMQTRWTHYGTQSRNRYLNPRLERDDRTGFDMQRIRFTIDGYAWTKDLTYNITLRADGPDANDVRIHYAYAAYRFADEFQFQAGTYQLSGTRSQLEANDGFALVDRGLVDAVFGFGNGTGVRFFGHLFEKKLSWYLDVVNSLNGQDNRTITPDPAEHDNNPAIIFRSVWHAMGENNLADFAIESDTRKDKTQPALDIGIFSYGFNDDRGDLGTTRIPFARPDRGRGVGGYGLTTTNGLQIHQFWWDVAFKYMGFSAQSEYVLRVVDPRHAFRRPFTPWSLLSGDDSTTAQHGAYAQVAYFLPIPGMENKVEVAARISGISALSERQEGSWEYSAGVNYYPLETHKVKLQTDFAKIYEVPISSSYSSYANVNDDALFFRVQLQVGF